MHGGAEWRRRVHAAPPRVAGASQKRQARSPTPQRAQCRSLPPPSKPPPQLASSPPQRPQPAQAEILQILEVAVWWRGEKFCLEVLIDCEVEHYVNRVFTHCLTCHFQRVVFPAIVVSEFGVANNDLRQWACCGLRQSLLECLASSRVF